MKWTKNQQKAIETTDRNVLLSAAAGSGKTSVLVERIIQLIIQKQVNIDEMLIITFTKAAAGEMRERIQVALNERIAKDSSDTQFLIKQINKISNANISTIHSFCMDVIKKNFHLIDLDPSFRIIDETEKELMFSQLLEDILELEYEKSKPEFIGLVESYTSNRGDENLKEMIKNVYQFIMSKPAPFDWLEDNVEKMMVDYDQINDHSWIQELKEIIVFELQSYRQMAENLETICTKTDGPQEYKEAIVDDIQSIDRLLERLSTDVVTFFETLETFGFKRFGRISGDRKEEVDSILQDTVKAIRKKYKNKIKKLRDLLGGKTLQETVEDLEKIYPLMKYLVQLMKRFDEQFKQEKFNKNAIDFNDLEHISLEILQNPSVARYYQNKFDYIFIDEYQDTNILQETIIDQIKREDNLFLVGDVKQSIYKFRLADPTLFLDKYERYTQESNKHQRVDLNKNFRSRQEILDGINYIFEKLMSKDFGEIDYNESTYLNPGLNFDPIPAPAIEINVLSTDDRDIAVDESIQELKNAEVEAKAIVSKIRNLLGTQTYDRKLEETRPIDYKDVVILMRATAGWGTTFEEVFMAAGIPLYYEGGEGYLDTTEIKIFLNLLRIIDNKQQDIPLISVMRSPIGGFAIDEIIEIRTLNQEMSFYDSLIAYSQQSENDLSMKIQGFLDQLHHWHKLSRIKSIDELIWIILDDTNFLNYVAAMPGGNFRKGNLKLLIERAKKFTETSITGLFNFIAFVEKMDKFSADLDTAKVIGENENVVRLMSVHKSKGLEFPVVILARGFRRIQSKSFANDILLHKSLGLGPKYVDFNQRVKSDTLPRILIKKKLTYEDLAEEMRILYVALTRSIDQLIIYGAYPHTLDKKIRTWTMDNSDKNLINQKTYLDWILSIVSDTKSALPLYERIGKAYHKSDLDLFTINLYDLNDLSEMIQQDEAAEINLKHKLMHNAFDVKDERFENYIETMFNKTIEKSQRKVPTKISVTELKTLDKIDIEEFKVNKYIPQLKEQPKFMAPDEGLTPIEIGNTYHFIMEKLDLTHMTREGIKEQINEFYNNGYLEQEQVAVVDVNKIFNFFNSKIGQKMIKSKTVKREVPFVFKDDTSEEEFLIQGIIDCYFYTDKNITIIDYKTDKINQFNEQELLKQHGVQINYYAKALQELTNKRVANKYLYFFENEKFYKIK